MIKRSGLILCYYCGSLDKFTDMDFLSDTRDQMFKSYIHIFIHSLKTIVLKIYSSSNHKSNVHKHIGPYHAPRPLRNLGLNCYLNAAFQSIVACPKFVNEMKDLEITYPTAKNLLVFNKTLAALSDNSNDSLTLPSYELLSNWNKDGEQDTFELLSHIIFQVFNELKRIKKEHSSGMMNSMNTPLPLKISLAFMMKCSSGHISDPKIQSDVAIHLPIPFRITSEELSMEKLMDNYFIEEDITDSKCARTTCDGQLRKFVTLNRPLPSTLCIHLQRSFWNSVTCSMQKNNERVKFLEKLVIKGKYFSLTRNTRCEEGLLFNTFKEMLNTIDFKDGTQVGPSKHVDEKEAFKDENMLITVCGGDMTSDKDTCMGGDGMATLSNVDNYFVITDAHKCKNIAVNPDNSMITNMMNGSSQVVTIVTQDDSVRSSEDNEGNEAEFVINECHSKGQDQKMYSSNDNKTTIEDITCDNGSLSVDEIVNVASLSVDIVVKDTHRNVENRTDARPNIFSHVVTIDTQDQSLISEERKKGIKTTFSINALNSKAEDEMVYSSSDSRVTIEDATNDWRDYHNGLVVTNTHVHQEEKMNIVHGNYGVERPDPTSQVVTIDVKEDGAPSTESEGSNKMTFIISELRNESKSELGMITENKDSFDNDNQNQSKGIFESINEDSASHNEVFDRENVQFEDEEYLLKSVIVHYGNAESGHYICHRKCGGRWFCTNDSFIREVNIGEVLNSEAYMLMYERD